QHFVKQRCEKPELSKRSLSYSVIHSPINSLAASINHRLQEYPNSYKPVNSEASPGGFTCKPDACGVQCCFEDSLIPYSSLWAL
ncbi:MAG: hypothetical protein QW545_07245, partial [Thermosphaera sp.]